MKSSYGASISAVVLFLGTSPIVRAQTILYDIRGETPGIYLGTCVASAGDVDGDGIPDFLAGTRLEGQFDLGFVELFSGRTGARIRSFQSGVPNDGFGTSAACIGDVDGDHVPDFAIGAEQHAAYQGNQYGHIWVVSGRSGAILYTIQGGALGWGIGRSLAAIGDLDHDGVPDFAEGSAWVNLDGTTLGTARVFSGRNGALIFTLSISQGVGGLGSSVAGPGDVDGDGVPDILVGEPFALTNGSNLGKASLYSGRDGSLMRSFRGHAQASQFGAAVAGAGDVDGDGRPDLIVGAPGDSTNGSFAGSVSVYSGADGSLLRILQGNPGDRLGGFLSAGGDVNGDGCPDLAVGATGAGVNGPLGGTVRLFSGRDGTLLAEIPSHVAGEGVGPCAMLGDLNGDGLADLAVGAPNSGDGGPYAGSARVYLLGYLPPRPYCQWKWNSQNCGSTPFVDGAPSLSVGDGMLVHVGAVLNHTRGFLLWGLARANVPFGGGSLCVQALDHGRIEDSGGNPGSGTDCTGTLGFRFTSSYLTAHGLLAGTRVFCQFLSRDNGYAPPDNIGLSQGLAFTVLP